MLLRTPPGTEMYHEIANLWVAVSSLQEVSRLRMLQERPQLALF